MAKEQLPAKLQVEALLFSSGKTMSEEQLATLSKLDARTVKKALVTLQKEYEERDGAISIYNDPTGWKMMVRETYVPVVKNIVADTELSRACMETLAVIAYKYPKVLQSEVIDIRGSGAYEHMAELERLGFISREPEGRSYAVKLTEKFFSYFDVAGGKDIKQVFKSIKVPKRVTMEGQQTLGGLQVVDAQRTPAEEHGARGKKVDGLEIVDENDDPQTAAASADDIGAAQAPDDATDAAAPQEDDAGNKFLNDLDARIANLTQRNDEHDTDETLKRKPLPGADETGRPQGEDATQEDASDSTADDDAPEKK